jgi:hypothetical protein
MKVKLLIQKTLVPGIPSAKAYQLVFTDENIYILFLSRDWGGFHNSGNLLGKVVLSVTGAISDNKIAEKLQEIENQNLDELIAKDKNSLKLKYEDIDSIKSKKKSFISGEAFVTIKSKDSGSFKFVLDYEEWREAILKIIQEKRPELIQ